MSDRNSTQSAPKALPPSEALKHATALCDEMDELMALHHFFYQSAEHFFGDQGLSFKRGLSLFPSWLRERDLNALDSLHQLQEALRSVKSL